MNLEDLNKAKIIEVLEIQQTKRKFVITPSSILRHLGFPVVSHSFIIQNKSTFLNIKLILKELEEEGFLLKRESKQDFLGIKEVGYDYIFKNTKN